MIPMWFSLFYNTGGKKKVKNFQLIFQNYHTTRIPRETKEKIIFNSRGHKILNKIFTAQQIGLLLWACVMENYDTFLLSFFHLFYFFHFNFPYCVYYTIWFFLSLPECIAWILFTGLLFCSPNRLPSILQAPFAEWTMLWNRYSCQLDFAIGRGWSRENVPVVTQYKAELGFGSGWRDYLQVTHPNCLVPLLSVVNHIGTI